MDGTDEHIDDSPDFKPQIRRKFNITEQRKEENKGSTW